MTTLHFFKNKNLLLLSLSLIISSMADLSLEAACSSKIDAGPAWVHIDVLESNHTIKKIDMPAIKADSTFLLWKGICLKPAFLYGRINDSETFSGSCGLGHYIPITSTFSITPCIGCTYTQFKTTLDLNPFFLDVKERFRSVSPYASLEASYCFMPGWRVCGIFQYVISRTHTTIKGFGTTKSHPKGPNYALVLEHDINANWSINIAGAYNISLTKEKHGLRAYGARIAAAYWF